MSWPKWVDYFVFLCEDGKSIVSYCSNKVHKNFPMLNCFVHGDHAHKLAQLSD